MEDENTIFLFIFCFEADIKLAGDFKIQHSTSINFLLNCSDLMQCPAPRGGHSHCFLAGMCPFNLKMSDIECYFFCKIGALGADLHTKLGPRIEALGTELSNKSGLNVLNIIYKDITKMFH